MTLTLTLNTAIQYFHCVIQFMMIHYQTQLGCKFQTVWTEGLMDRQTQ